MLPPVPTTPSFKVGSLVPSPVLLGTQIRPSVTALWMDLFPPPDHEHLRTRMVAYANRISITRPGSWCTGAQKEPF